MTEDRSPIDATTARRRLTLAAEDPTLPYAADTDTDAARREPVRGSGGDGAASDRRPSDGRSFVSSVDPARVRSAPADPAPADPTVDAGEVDLAGLLDGAAAAVGRLGRVAPATIHPDGLGDALTRLRRVRNRLEAVETSWLTQVRNRKVHRDDGARSASSWAAERLGGSQRDAADQLRTADRLVDLPDTAGAFTDGHITREAASAIGRAMQDRRLRDSDDAEGRLLAAAREGGADQVRRTARQMRATADVDAAEQDAARKRAARYANVHRRGDGMVKIDALLDQDNGEPFITAYQALFNPSRPDDDTGGHDGSASTGGGMPPEDTRTSRQRGADTLGEMARRSLATDRLPDSGGRRPTVLVTIPRAVLHGELSDGAAQMAFTGPIAPSTARRYACDAAIVPVVLDGNSVPIDIGRASRQPTVAQRRCLAVRDRCCRMCGTQDRVLTAHHCTHWVHGGPTDLHNLILLCWACHHLVHEGHWKARWRPDNTVTFTHPDGRRLVRGPPP